MDHRQLLIEAARRPLDTAEILLDGISKATLHRLPADRGNSIAWLVWHAARQMDVQLADLNDEDQVWVCDQWAEKLGVDLGPDAFGFGDDRDAVAALRVKEPQALREYLAAVVQAMSAYIQQLGAPDLDVIVDRDWDPPTSRGVRIVNMIDDASVHLGQAAYARGLIEDWSIGY